MKIVPLSLGNTWYNIWVCSSPFLLRNWWSIFDRFFSRPRVAIATQWFYERSYDHANCYMLFAPCKVIQIPESRRFFLVESGILGIGIQNPAVGIQNPAKEWTRIHLLKIHFKSYWRLLRASINRCRVQFTHMVNQYANLGNVYTSHRICLEHQHGRYLIALEHLRQCALSDCVAS